MSNEAMTWAWAAPIENSSIKFVLVTMANWADEEGSCYPSERRIAQATSLSESTVHRAIKWLTEEGYIRGANRRTNDDGRQLSNRFFLAVGEPPRGSAVPREGVNVVPGEGVTVNTQEGYHSDTPNKDTSEKTLDTADAVSMSGKQIATVRHDVEALCRQLSQRIEANGVRKSKATVTDKWRTEARLLLDRDNVALAEAMRVLNWCQDDQFWRANILSMPKFREKFDQLRLASNRTPGYNQGEPRKTAAEEWLERAARHRAEEERRRGSFPDGSAPGGALGRG